MLTVRGLGKDYGAHVAVEGLDLDVMPGQIVGLLGPNGAGKTTTISMMAGVLAPSRGRVEICGRDLASSGRAARRHLGLVPQDVAVYEELTAEENLGFFACTYGLDASERRRRVLWALAFAGLEDRARTRVRHFSGGMKRRLNLAVAVLHQPDVMILDEPTVGVDPQSRAHVFAQIRRLRDEQKVAILYTSHHMDEVEELCDRVAIIDRGRLVAEGGVSDLLRAHAADGLFVAVEGEPSRAVAILRDFGPLVAAEGGFRVRAQASPGRIAGALEAGGVRVLEMRAGSTDLGSVFLALTGHALRDD
jgi:ABC-2 type transport system ATP-binding protein